MLAVAAGELRHLMAQAFIGGMQPSHADAHSFSDAQLFLDASSDFYK